MPVLLSSRVAIAFAENDPDEDDCIVLPRTLIRTVGDHRYLRIAPTNLQLIQTIMGKDHQLPKDPSLTNSSVLTDLKKLRGFGENHNEAIDILFAGVVKPRRTTGCRANFEPMEITIKFKDFPVPVLKASDPREDLRVRLDEHVMDLVFGAIKEKEKDECVLHLGKRTYEETGKHTAATKKRQK